MYSSTKVQVLSRIPATLFFSVRKLGVYHIVEVDPGNMSNRLSPAVFCSFKLPFDAAAFQYTAS